MDRHPDLGDEAAIRLIFEELRLRIEAGMEVGFDEIARRSPAGATNSTPCSTAIGCWRPSPRRPASRDRGRIWRNSASWPNSGGVPRGGSSSRLSRRQYAEAAGAMKQGQDLAGHLPAAEGYREALREGLSLARSGAMADDLRRLAEYLRFRYGIDPPPPEESRELVRRGRSLWQARGSILGHRARRDGPASEPVIRDDLLDFALAWADLGVRSASADRAGEARREALRVLAEAEALLGPSPAIDRERRVYSGGPDGPNPAPGTAPLTARDHHDLGRSYLRSGEVARAAEQFRHGLALRPQDFWLNFFEGLYAYRLGHFDDASAAFRVCIALSPETAECSYNRALARASLGQADLALADYSRALRLNPSLAEAALNRGILHFQAARLDEASADPDRALAASRDRGLRAIIRYNMAVVAMARGDRASALAHSGTASDLGHPGARELRKNLRPEPSRGPLPGPKSRSVFPAHRPSNSPGMISGMTVRTLTFGR